MAMSEHTKEPWGTNGDPYVFAGNKSIAFCDTARNGDDENKSNARRIVACVNACEGLPTELIEKHGVTRSGIAKATEQLSAENAELKQTCIDHAEIQNALRAENAKLRKDAERLKKLLAIIRNDSYAITFQSLKQYREFLLSTAKEGK